ncbi:hypothetical protein COL82_31270 [Bacillus toyonensis]|uniref:hypothetical protein n=1 Tax=Bacillus cereus group TaxID=86661 RepID=UPI000BF9B9EE|nr:MULTISPECIES: hypothetical protein [Bacillus cereus group]MBJ7932190.1 hypothetical protein [Bacillus cereus group sp. N31]PFZ69743.1 hypothetical protein COL82_31270 [Bacillus toyonensis]
MPNPSEKGNIEQWIVSEPNNDLCVKKEVVKNIKDYIGKRTDAHVVRNIDSSTIVISANIEMVKELQDNYGECIIISLDESISPLNQY